MPTTYAIADDTVKQTMRRVCERWHSHLRDCGARIEVLMAYSDTSEPLKRGGYPALALVKVVPLKDRMTKQHDAEIFIDAVEWERLRDEQQEALFDHELSHLSVKNARYFKGKTDETGEETEWLEFDKDDINRPVLKLRNGDWNAGDGFSEVVKRHGQDAIEFVNLRRCHGWAEQAARGEEVDLG